MTLPKPDLVSGSNGHQITQRRRLGATRHAALMLAMQGKHAEAARRLLEVLQTPPEEYGRLGDEERRLVTMAATYLQKAGDRAGAAHLFGALGDVERCSLLEVEPHASPPSEDALGSRQAAAPDTDADTHSEARIPESTVQSRPAEVSPDAGQPRNAIGEARVLMGRGDAEGAAAVLAEGGYAYEAGICFLKAGRPDAALAQLAQVPSGTPHYPAAARTAIRIAGRVGLCDRELYRFVQPFLAKGPSDPKELELFRRLAQLLEERTLIEEAVSVLNAAHANFPDDVIVQDRLAALTAHAGAPDSLIGDEESAALSVQLLQPMRAAQPRRGMVPAPPRSVDPSAWMGDTGLGHMAHLASDGGARVGSSLGSAVAEEFDAESVRVSAIPAPGDCAQEWVPGTIVGGRFRLDGMIGQGGMAQVFSATDLELDEEVALKVFSGQLVTEDYLQEAVQRFRQELKLCRRLNHPNIIQVYDIGIHGGHRYFTMELLRGQSLGDMLGVPLDLDNGLRILLQACAGLSAAHEQGVVHRDVKPDNIFVTSDGTVKIMDFGIAKSSVTSGQTTFGTIAGTPEYMSPEQINDFSAAGPAADQYSLGVVAYEMFTGQVPFAHEHMVVLLTMHLEATPTPPTELNPALPDELEATILRMLAKDPRARFESCEQVQSAFLELHSMFL